MLRSNNTHLANPWRSLAQFGVASSNRSSNARFSPASVSERVDGMSREARAKCVFQYCTAAGTVQINHRQLTVRLWVNTQLEQGARPHGNSDSRRRRQSRAVVGIRVQRHLLVATHTLVSNLAIDRHETHGTSSRRVSCSMHSLSSDHLETFWDNRETSTSASCVGDPGQCGRIGNLARARDWVQ